MRKRVAPREARTASSSSRRVARPICRFATLTTAIARSRKQAPSSASKAGGPVCQNNKIPMISPSSTNPTVTAIGDYIFRVCFIDPFQGLVMAKFAKSKLNATTAGVFIDNAMRLVFASALST